MDFDAHTNDSEDDYNAFVDRIVNSTTEELRQASDKTEKQELALRRYFHLAYKANLSPSEAWDFLAIDDGCILESAGLSEEEIERAVKLSQTVSQQVIEQIEIPENTLQ